MTKTLLEPTTDAAASKGLYVEDDFMATLILYALAGLGAENADLQISHDEGTTWQDVYVDGAQMKMNSTNNVVTAVGPGFFRVNKAATANATGVYVVMRG